MKQGFTTNRDSSIDLLRFIGLTCIMLVHVYPPEWISQLREFDVCLMVFISTMCYKPITKDEIKTYYWKRTKRLIVPTWIFITIYLLLMWTIQEMGYMSCGLTLSGIIPTYFIVGDQMGYVWVIKVFLLTMLVTPIINNLESKLGKYSYIIFCLVLIFLQSLLILWYNEFIPKESLWYLLFDKVGLYATGYSFVILCALRIKRCISSGVSSNILSLISIIALALMFGVYIISMGLPIDIDLYKYPPQSYYLLYGVLVSTLLWSNKESIGRILNAKFCKFVGSNTLWIYFYHVFPVMIVNQFIGNWILKFLIIYPVSIGLYYIHYTIVRKSNNDILKKIFN